MDDVFRMKMSSMFAAHKVVFVAAVYIHHDSGKKLL